MRYFWSVRDEGLYIYEKRERIAIIKPDQFVHLVEELSQHIRYPQGQKPTSEHQGITDH